MPYPSFSGKQAEMPKKEMFFNFALYKFENSVTHEHSWDETAFEHVANWNDTVMLNFSSEKEGV